VKTVHILCIGCALTGYCCALTVKNEKMAGIACGIYFQFSGKFYHFSDFLINESGFKWF
jgi:hypothetical protein